MDEQDDVLFSELASLARNRNRAVSRGQWLAAAGFAMRMDQTERCAVLLGIQLPPVEPKIDDAALSAAQPPEPKR